MKAEELKTAQKAEALKRMKTLKIMKQPIKEFEEEDKLNLSEHIGILYWLDEEEEKMVKEFEDKNMATVYHVIKSLTSIGLMYSLMYVSQYPEEWEQDNEDIKEGIALCYVVNKDMPDCSEFGSIGIKPMNGGVARIW